MTSTHGALSSFMGDCKQASILPPPGCTFAQTVLISALHSFAAAAALINMIRHGSGGSAQCELRQDPILPPPAGTSPHAALISCAHTSRCCAIVDVDETNTNALIAKIVFSIGCTPDCCSPSAN